MKVCWRFRLSRSMIFRSEGGERAWRTGAVHPTPNSSWDVICKERGRVGKPSRQKK